MAMGPGVLSAMATTSMNSSCSIHLRRVTNSPSSNAIMAYPPPKAKQPIYSMDRNNSSIVLTG